MRSYELPALPHTVYGRGELLKRELAEFVSYAQRHSTSANALEAWFTSASAAVAAALAAASPAA